MERLSGILTQSFEWSLFFVYWLVCKTSECMCSVFCAGAFALNVVYGEPSFTKAEPPDSLEWNLLCVRLGVFPNVHNAALLVQTRFSSRFHSRETRPDQRNVNSAGLPPCLSEDALFDTALEVFGCGFGQAIHVPYMSTSTTSKVCGNM